MKTYKYSTYMTLALTLLSMMAIFAFDDVFPNVSIPRIRDHIIHNLDNYNAFLFGIFTGSLVSLIVAVVGYEMEKRKAIRDVWNHGRKLTIDFRLLLLDNIDYKNLTPDTLMDRAKQSDFNAQVREWEAYHNSEYVMSTMELDFMFKRGKTVELLDGLQENIAHLWLVVEGFMNAFLNDKLEKKYGEVDIENLLAVITETDENKALSTVQRHLDEIIKLLKKGN